MFLIAILTVAALQKKGSSNYINSLTIKKLAKEQLNPYTKTKKRETKKRRRGLEELK